MKAIVLVGGQGTRMRPLTDHLPKAMAPIVNVPSIELIVRWLAQHGVDEVVLSLGYLPDTIQRHFASHPVEEVRILYVVEEAPLGTGSAMTVTPATPSSSTASPRAFAQSARRA